MRNLKKFLALVLAMVMTFSLMLTVNAKDVVKDWADKDQVTEKFVEAVDVLSGMEVFQGDEKGFRPGDTIIRAEVAALIYRLATGDTGTEKMDLYTTTHPFTDVKADDWFAGYVGYCWNAGYIKGTTATTFNPYAPVTGYETLAMVLRAMGYDANDEFTGAQWIVNVSATATQRGLLNDVKSTNYANTLHMASRRDVVASILFNAALKDRVKYTPAFGYQTGDHIGGSIIDDHYNEYTPLGKMNFGLTSETAIILGNQATGEKYTLLGVNSVPYEVSGKEGYSADTRYVYPGTQIPATGVTPNADNPIDVPMGTTLTVKTGLDLFGHKVTAWYCKFNNSTAPYKTYAVFDEATLAKTVYSPDTTHGGKLSTADATKTQSMLGIEAQKAGFSVDLGTNGSTAYVSDVYSRILGGNGTDSRPAVSAYGVSVVDTPFTLSPNGIYALISNNADKTVDVIIPLSAEVAEITQKDTVATTQTLTLAGRGTAITTPTTQITTATSSFESGTGVIKMKSLVEGSETGLGSKVTAWQVKGTADSTVYAGSTWTGSKGSNANMPYYQLDKITKEITGTVVSYDSQNAEGKLTLTDGTVLERSWLWTKVVKGAVQTPFTTGVAAQFLAGVTYTIVLDDDGRWLGAKTADKDFLYVTYADFSVGDLGTGTSQYALTGVNWDGEKVINHPFISFEDSAAYGAGTGEKYPSAANGSLGDGYNKLVVTQKNYNTAASGNQVLTGANTGYRVDAEGNTDELAGTLINDGGTIAGYNWKVTAQDAKNGFVDVSGDGKLMMTNNTMFIVVSGSGSADLKVEIYNGLTEFLKGAREVSLATGTPTYTLGKWTSGAKDRSYYITDADLFNKVDTGNDKMISRIIMSVDDLTYVGANDLYFSYDTTATGTKLAGAANTVEQYKLWKDGVEGLYFIDSASGYGPVPSVGGSSFYDLIQVDEVNGVPIYGAAKTNRGSHPWIGNLGTYDGICNYGLTYRYYSVNNLATANFLGAWGSGKTAEILDVSNAKVIDLEYNSVTCTHEKIDTVELLNRAVSGLDTRNVTVAIVYEGVNVSTIYVTNVTPA